MFTSFRCMAATALLAASALVLTMSDPASSTADPLPRPPKLPQQQPIACIPVQVQVSLYEVELPPDGTFTMSATELEKRAATLTEFESALSSVGKTTRIATLERSADLTRDMNVSLGGSVPLQGSTYSSKDEKTHRSVTYNETGVSLEIGGNANASEPGFITADIDLSYRAIAASVVPIDDEVMARTFTKQSERSRIRFQFGFPRVTLSSYTYPNRDSKTMLVTRYYFLSELERN